MLRRFRYGLGFPLALAVAVIPTRAQAHFNLSAPPNWTTETTQGSPEKEWPCGNEDSAMATGPTTPFTAGQKITIKLTETITHGGHYRVALAPSGDMMDLPPDMSTTASGANCQNDDMQADPVMPVIADGLLEHQQNQPLSGEQSVEVTLPSDVSCTKCVLQVREYMTPHGSAGEIPTQTNGCYYHHCAFISISAATGSGGMSSGGMSSGGMSSSMGGMSVSAGMGGSVGQGGVVGAGGAPSGGGPTGGSGGHGTAGMATATGGSPTTGAGGMATTANGGRASSGGGMVGTGGGSGTVGTSGMASSAAGTAPTGMPVPAPTDAADTGGCGCQVPSRRGGLPYGAAGALALGLSVARRRRQR